jgi:choline dehydrogenase
MTRLDFGRISMKLSVRKLSPGHYITVLTLRTAYPNIQDIMATTYTTWLSTLSSQIPSALTSLSTAQSLDATVLKGITAQFAAQLDMLKNGVGQLEIIMTMLSGAGSAGIQVAQQHAWSRGSVVITSASAFDYPTINPVSHFGLLSRLRIVSLLEVLSRIIYQTAGTVSLFLDWFR